MSYATHEDVQARLIRELGSEERELCSKLLEDAAVIIDSNKNNATEEQKKVVSCRMVIRAIGNGDGADVPIGATQGTMSALGYSQTWTLSNGSAGELYLSKNDKKMLGIGNSIGSYSPIQDM